MTTRQIEQYSERQRIADQMNRLQFVDEPETRWPMASILFIAAALAVAGFLRGGF